MCDASSSRRLSSSSSSSSSISWARPKPAWKPHALPVSTNIDGRPVWEAPILSYSHLIDAESDMKRRDAVMEYTGRNIVRTTEIMDVFTEVELIGDYFAWVLTNCNEAEDEESASFFGKLRKELLDDLREVHFEKGSGLVRQPGHGEIAGGISSDNRPGRINRNYRFKTNEDGTMVFLPPFHIAISRGSPAEGKAGNEGDEDEGEDESSKAEIFDMENVANQLQQSKEEARPDGNQRDHNHCTLDEALASTGEENLVSITTVYMHKAEESQLLAPRHSNTLGLQLRLSMSSSTPGALRILLPPTNQEMHELD